MKHIKSYRIFESDILHNPVNVNNIVTDEEITKKIVKPIKDILLELEDEGYETNVLYTKIDRWIYVDIIFPSTGINPLVDESSWNLISDVCDRIEEFIKSTGWYSFQYNLDRNTTHGRKQQYRILLKPADYINNHLKPRFGNGKRY